MYIFLVTFEEHFSWPGELNVKSGIKILYKYSCVTEGRKYEWFAIQQDAKIKYCDRSISAKKPLT
jgi:hypothetical protein